MMDTARKGIETRKRIKAFIIEYMQEHGYSPTFKEICAGTGIKSTSSINVHIKKMMDDGDLETDVEFQSSRAIRVPGYEFVKLDELQRCSKPPPTKNGHVQMVYK